MVDALVKQHAGSFVPIAPNTPVLLFVEYIARSVAWLDKGNVVHHLNAPSVTAMCKIVGDALVQQGCVRPGQLAGMRAAKFSGDVNRLSVTLLVVTQVAKRDTPNMRYKMLVWYRKFCRESGRTPTSKGFWSMLKALGNEDGVTQGEKDVIDAKLFAKAKAGAGS
jgi:hypothetical protein